MLQKLMSIASTFLIAAISLPDYLGLHFVGNSVFFFGEPEYPSQDE